MSTRKNLAHAARLAKRRASLTVAPGEHLIEHYCHDATECQCAPTGACGGVPTVPVGRSEACDRCLQCGTVWPVKMYRDDGRQRRGRLAGWLDDYLRPEVTA